MSDGAAGLLLDPQTRLEIFRRGRGPVIGALAPYAGEVVRTRRWVRPMSGPCAAIVDFPSTGSQPRRRILVDGGRRRPVVGLNTMLIEVRRGRVVAATPGATVSGATVGESAPASSDARISTRIGQAGGWKNLLVRAPRMVTRIFDGGRSSSYAVVTSPNGDDVAQVPDHVREALLAAGCDVSGHRMSIDDQRANPTQKVLVRLRRPADGDELIVKVVRNPADGYRIENEAHMLAVLTGIPEVRDLVPIVRATGQIGDRPYLAQACVAGEPLHDLLSAGDDRAMPALDAVVAWQVTLASRTRHSPSPGELASIGTLVERFVTAVKPGTDVVGRLVADADLVADPASDLPLTLMHGDLGTWNIMVGQSGEATVLDWEAGEVDGVPLWDLFYLLRNACVAPNADRPGEAVREHLLGDTHWNARLVAAIRSATESTGISLALVPSLYRLCWVHRAVKQISRLGVGDSARGYVDLALHSARLPEAYLRDCLLRQH